MIEIGDIVEVVEIPPSAYYQEGDHLLRRLRVGDRITIQQTRWLQSLKMDVCYLVVIPASGRSFLQWIPSHCVKRIANTTVVDHFPSLFLVL